MGDAEKGGISLAICLAQELLRATRDGTTVFYVPSAVVQFLAFAADNERTSERPLA